MSSNKIFIWIQALATVGVLLAVYLLWEQFTKSPSLCSINATINCDAIISGAVSKTFGIATPLYGLAGYLVMFLAASLRWKKVLVAVATFGLAFCLWIAYQELFLLHVICPVCIACQLIMLTAFCLSLVVLRKDEQASLPQS